MECFESNANELCRIRIFFPAFDRSFTMIYASIGAPSATFCSFGFKTEMLVVACSPGVTTLKEAREVRTLHSQLIARRQHNREVGGVVHSNREWMHPNTECVQNTECKNRADFGCSGSRH